MLSRRRDLEVVRTRLAEWLAARLPDASDLGVSALQAPGAGFSNETLLFDLSYRTAGAPHVEPLVVRLTPEQFQVFPEYDLARQYHVMRCLAPTDVPVPRVRWLEEDAHVLGSPFFVMDRLAGDIPSEVPPYHANGFCTELSPAERARLWWSGIETLARIHLLDWQTLGLGFLGAPRDPADALDRHVDYYARFLDWARGETAHPVYAAALDWLRAHRYVPERIALCWGDARLPNVIYRHEEVVGVLDWEMAFLGDPEADLGWWLFMDWHHSVGFEQPRLPGLPGREETIARYEALTGRLARHAVYNEVLAAVRFGIILVKVFGNLAASGSPLADPSYTTDNPCTRRLTALLDL